MSEETPIPDLGMPCVPATWGHLKMVLAALEEEGVDYVLIGGFAMNLLGRARQTGDIDILVRDRPDNNERWIRALSRMPDGAAAALEGVANPFSADPEMVSDPEEGEEDEYILGVVRINDAFVIDVMSRACGETFESLEKHILRVERGGLCFCLLNAEGMLLTKRGVRPKDVEDNRWLSFNLHRITSELDPPPPLPR